MLLPFIFSCTMAFSSHFSQFVTHRFYMYFSLEHHRSLPTHMKPRRLPQMKATPMVPFDRLTVNQLCLKRKQGEEMKQKLLCSNS